MATWDKVIKFVQIYPCLLEHEANYYQAFPGFSSLRKLQHEA